MRLPILALIAAALLPAASLAGQPAPGGATIGADAIAEELKRDLAGSLPSGPVELAIDETGLRLAVPPGAAPAIAVDGLSFDARSGRLSAYVAAADDPVAERVRVTGRVWRLIELPVLNRPVAPGEVVGEHDIDLIQVRADQLTQTFIGETAQLIGRTPRRAIRPGAPVRPGDVQLPILVKKGELVTVVLQAPGMLLTAQAKALEDGAMGAAIRVSNTRSGRMLDAVVAGPGTAQIAPAAALAAR